MAIETMVFDDAYNCHDGYEHNNDDSKYPKMLEAHTIIVVDKPLVWRAYGR